MNDSTNSLGAAIGGNVQTSNPQNVGGQDLTPSQSNLQPGGLNLLNSSGLRITDEKGNVLNTSTTTVAKPTVTIKKTVNHHVPVVFGVSALVIIFIFAATWIMTRQMNKNSY